MFDNINLDDMVNIVNNSTSFKDLLQNLGYSQNSGSVYCALKQYLIDNNIDFSHFYISNNTNFKASLEDMLVLNPSCTVVNQRLVKRLVNENLMEYKCFKCGNTGIWNGKPLTLQLEHKNGNNRDYRLYNLCLLCPNCHSQTDTYCGKNRNAYNIPDYVIEVKNLLSDTDISIDNIAYKFGISRATVYDINVGLSYHDDSLVYPLRQKNDSIVVSNVCENCGKIIDIRSKLCNKCEGLRRKSLHTLPITRDDLKTQIRTRSFVKIAEDFGVSDNAIRKWCKKYDLPYNHNVIKSISDEDWSKI